MGAKPEELDPALGLLEPGPAEEEGRLREKGVLEAESERPCDADKLSFKSVAVHDFFSCC